MQQGTICKSKNDNLANLLTHQDHR